MVPDDSKHNDLSGKTAIVTGSASGIGRAMVLALVGQGMTVAGFDLDAEAKQTNKSCLAITCDISDAREVDKAVNLVYEQFGHIDVLINNAGIFQFSHIVGMPHQEALQRFDQCMAVNARGAYLCILQTVPHMIKHGGGQILNIITNHVFRTQYRPSPIEQGYDASKWAQLSLNETTAAELQPHHISVNALCPAATDTPMLRSFFKHAGYGDQTPAQILAKGDSIKTLMNPDDVALAAVNVLSWGCDGPSGHSFLIKTRKDCEALSSVCSGHELKGSEILYADD